jgi:hypothetical protein
VAKRAVLQPRVRRRHFTTGTLALQPLLRRFVSTPGKTPPELQPRERRHHLTPGDIGAAAAATPLRLYAYAQRNARRCSRARRRHQRLTLQPRVRCRHLTPGDIGAAASAAPLRLDA